MSASTSTAAPRSGVMKKVGIIVGVLLLLVIVLWFYVTSAGFFRSFVLPKVGQAMNAKVTVDDVALSPFSSVTLKGLKVETSGTTPLVTVSEVRVRYSLMDILGGKITVNELTVESPLVQVVSTADGKSNLDPVLAGNGTETAPDKGGKPPTLNIHNVSINNATLRMISQNAQGAKTTVEVQQLKLSVDQLVSGGSGKLQISSGARVDREKAGSAAGTLQGDLQVGLDAANFPQSIQGAIRCALNQAQGDLASLNGFGIALDADMSPTEVKQLALKFTQGAKELGAATLSGPFDAGKREGKLKLAVTGIDRNVLSPLGAAYGMDFGNTVIRAAADVDLAQAGQSVHVKGDLAVNQFSLRTGGQTTPTLDVASTYDVTADLAGQVAKIAALDLMSSQGGRSVLKGNLSSPMTLAWGPGTAPAGDSTFQVGIQDLNLPDWKAFTGDMLTAGRLTGTFKINAQKAGHTIGWDGGMEIRDLGLKLGTPPIQQALLQMQLLGSAEDFKKFSLTDLKLNLTRGNQPALAVQGKAAFDQGSGAFTLQTAVQIVAARLLGSGPSQPVSLQLAGEGVANAQQTSVKGLKLTLPSTQLATPNEATVNGQLSQVSPGIQSGQFLIEAKSLDLTALYEIAMAGKAPANAAAPATGSTSNSGNVEPAPEELPFKPLGVDLKIGQLFVGEIAVTELEGKLKVDGGKVALEPFKCQVNKAPVSMAFSTDMGVSPRPFKLTAKADAVPLAPLANTLSSDFKNQVNGLGYANVDFTGSGSTGVNLKKTLGGSATLIVTNATIHVVSGSHKLWFLPIDLNLIATLLNIPEITKSPVTGVDALVKAGNGRIELQQADVRGDAFRAQALGGVTLADVLDQSRVDVPLDISLSRSVAQKANLMDANTPTNAVYLMLPRFAALSGTLANIETKTDKAQLIQLTARAATGLLGGKVGSAVGNAVGNAGQAIGNLGNLLTGKGGANTNAASTNKGAAPSLNPLDLFKKKKQ